jgi:hypothetical protein
MVLDHTPRNAREIHERIVAGSLFEFRAKDPLAMVRAAIRAHLKTHGAAGQPPARVRIVDRDLYVRL